jgi:uncharacterized protein (TIGR00369 family)
MPTGIELARVWLAGSPFVQRLGIRVDELADGLARLTLPYSADIVTTGDLVHGGAIGTLIDTAATAAAWAVPEPLVSVRGTTVDLTVAYLAGARGQDVTAVARVLRRGKSICFCDVEVRSVDDVAVAKGLVTYKLG